MKILVLEESPHINGTSNTIAKEFIKGAKENGNEVEIIDVAHANLHPCLGCDQCFMNRDCIQNDDGNAILHKILKADCLLFVTPIYYFAMSAQLKTLVDRFYAYNTKITHKHLKVIYIAAAWNNDNVVMKAFDKHIDILSDYLNFEVIGKILAIGAGTPSMINQSYLKEAYQLGKSI